MTCEPSRTATAPIGQAAAAFLASERIAVTGVSRSSQNHSGNPIYRPLRDRSYPVFAINPDTDTVEGDPSFDSLASIPGDVHAVAIATNPKRTETTLHECISLGINHVWMHHGPSTSSVSPTAVTLGRNHDLISIDGGCPLMSGPTAGTGHTCIRAVRTLVGRIPGHIEDTPRA